MTSISLPIGSVSKPAKGEQIWNSGYIRQWLILAVLFSIWGMITSMNFIIIPILEDALMLRHWQVMLVQTVFFGSYFLIWLFFYVFGKSAFHKGHKNGSLGGLLITTVGSTLFYPAANSGHFGLFLIAIMLLAIGLAVLQKAMSPYVENVVFNSKSNNSFNSILIIISTGMLLVSLASRFLIHESSFWIEDSGTQSLKTVYLALTSVLLVSVFLIRFLKMPTLEKTHSLDSLRPTQVAKHANLFIDGICFFVLVGGEVCILSMLISFAKLPTIGALTSLEAGQSLSYYLGGALVGRLFYALANKQYSQPQYKYFLLGGLTIGLFALLFLLLDLQVALGVGLLVSILLGIIWIENYLREKVISLLAIAVILLLVVATFTTGLLAMWAVVSIGIFSASIFPIIVKNTVLQAEDSTKSYSFLLVMAVVGSALIPLFQGLLADILGSIQFSFLIPIACFGFVVFYGFKDRYAQNIKSEETNTDEMINKLESHN